MFDEGLRDGPLWLTWRWFNEKTLRHLGRSPDYLATRTPYLSDTPNPGGIR